MESRATRRVLIVLSTISVVFVGIAMRSEGFLRDLLLHLGAGLVGAVITFIIFEIYLAEMKKAEGEETKGIDYHEFVKRIRSSYRLIRVLGTYTYLLSRDHLRHEFREAVSYALRNREDIIVQFLLLDPFSDAARQREEDRKDEKVIEKIVGNLLELYYLKQDPIFAKIEVKIYDALPPISLFQCDDRASMSFYPRDQAISQTDRFELSMETPLGKFLTRTFESLWKHRTTKSLEEYMFLKVRLENPLTRQQEEYRVHFVREERIFAFYLLLNKQHDKWAWGLPLSHKEPIALRIRWENSEVDCAGYEIAQGGDEGSGLFERVFELAVAKYARYDYQKVLELRRPLAS